MFVGTREGMERKNAELGNQQKMGIKLSINCIEIIGKQI